jgi:hypothetical protein
MCVCVDRSYSWSHQLNGHHFSVGQDEPSGLWYHASAPHFPHCSREIERRSSTKRGLTAHRRTSEEMY